MSSLNAKSTRTTGTQHIARNFRAGLSFCVIFLILQCLGKNRQTVDSLASQALKSFMTAQGNNTFTGTRRKEWWGFFERLITNKSTEPCFNPVGSH